jgi:hypothetical protein
MAPQFLFSLFTPLKCFTEMMREGVSFKCSLEDLLQYIICYCNIASSKSLCNDILDVENPWGTYRTCNMPSSNDFGLLYFIAGPLWCVFYKHQEFTCPFSTNQPEIYPSLYLRLVSSTRKNDTGWVMGTHVLKHNKLVPLPVRRETGSSLTALMDACTLHIPYFKRRRHSMACMLSWPLSVWLLSLGVPQV